MTHSDKPLNPHSTDELAALYALDILDADAQIEVEQAFAEVEGFAQQVKEAQETIAAIPYSVAPMPLSADLKNRLFQRLDRDPEPSDSTLWQLLERSISALKQQAEQLTWAPMMGTNATEIATWQTDEHRREVAFFVRKTEGGLFPNHAHASGETVLVLEGDFRVEGRVYGVGDRINSVANTTHQPATQQGCLLLCISSKDDEILG